MLTASHPPAKRRFSSCGVSQKPRPRGNTWCILDLGARRSKPAPGIADGLLWFCLLCSPPLRAKGSVGLSVWSESKRAEEREAGQGSSAVPPAGSRCLWASVRGVAQVQRGRRRLARTRLFMKGLFACIPQFILYSREFYRISACAGIHLDPHFFLHWDQLLCVLSSQRRAGWSLTWFSRRSSKQGARSAAFLCFVYFTLLWLGCVMFIFFKT